MHMIPAGTVALLTLFTLSAGVPAAPLVFEAETCSTPTDAWIRNRDTPDHWNLWSTDKNAKNWSGGVVLRAPTVHTDRTAPEQGAPALHTRLTGIPPGTSHVEVKPGGRPLGLSLDGTHWVKFRGGFIARDVAIRDGTFELWADDRYACDPGPGAGSGYYDTIVLHPKIESVNGVPNPGFELADEPGAPPPGWTWHTNGTPSPTLTQAPDAHSGRRALRIRAEADARWYLRATERFKVAPGDEYRLIAWIKSASPNGVRMGLAGFDPEGAPAGRFGRGEMGAALTD